MTSLYEALQCLQPTSWDAVPQSPDELRDYLRDIFKNGRLVGESVPDPPPYENQESNDAESQTETPFRVVPSSARVGETDEDITSMQKQWGKPIKVGGPKENPLGVHVWKLSANDGGGSWFGRRSVHAGLPYDRWQTKLSSEYEETLKVNRKKLEKGQTADKAIRGIGAEEKVETITVKDDDGSVMGQVMLYHVSAQFPKPTAPRDFVALIITSEVGLQIGGTTQPGRSWMMISRPCEHPDVPHKQGYTRGQYESVEIIREIRRKSGDGSSSSEDAADKASGTSEESGTNPVEWIMVSRSDPGGSIPRWMVDKGTPRSVGTDAAKFVDWAVQDEHSGKQADSSSSNSAGESQGNGLDCADSADDSGEDLSDSDSDSDVQSHHGLIASVTGLINTGYKQFGPQSFLGYGSPQPREKLDEDHIKVSEEKSDKPQSTKSATSKHAGHLDPTSAAQADQASLSSAQSDTAIPRIDDVVHNNIPPAELIQKTKDGKLSSHEKELAKLALRKREIESKLETIRSSLENLHLPAQSAPATPTKGVYDMDSDQSGMIKRAAENRSSTPASSGKESQRESNSSGGQPSSQTGTNTPTQEPSAQQHKAATQLLNEESKMLKQLRKVEGNQLKVATKIEARQRKEAERSEKSRSRSEAEGLRQEIKDLKKEVSNLRSERQKWVDLVASLQAENTKLLAQHERS